ncbi:hypothetical protein HDU93_009465 [Gonapodya sp. JEL0774]|nr:hypothetical protein HDU93_009465 [Gonapodya sp. JEL0774]
MFKGLVIQFKRTRQASTYELKKIDATKPGSGEDKVAVNAEFWRRLSFILKICIPSWRSKEAGLVLLHTVFLIARTWLSVIVAELDGSIVKHLIAANWRSFGRGLAYWFLIAIPATFTNSMIKYFQSKLALEFRTRLTQHVHGLYLDKNTFYKVINLDNRIEGPDQHITTDINRFATALANLYSNLGKPVLDLLIFNYQLAINIGASGTWALALNYILTFSAIRMVTPPFGKMAAREAKLEGDFRYAHSRIITNAEEIAFYNGGALELSILSWTYRRLISHINSIYTIRIAYNMFEDFIIKYSWSAVGLSIAAVPVFFPELAGRKMKSMVEKSEAEDKVEMAEAAESAARGEVVRPRLDKKMGANTQSFITNKRWVLKFRYVNSRETDKMRWYIATG